MGAHFQEKMKYIPHFLFVLSILLYANTLGHGFVLDDEVVLTQNSYVQHGVSDIGKIFSEDTFAGYLKSKGVSGQIITGGRYRPLSLVFFALMVQFLGNNAIVFHAFNVLLFAACTLFFYKALRTLSQQFGFSIWFAAGAATLFAVHPVHTEVVANIKSADELLSFLFGMLAFSLAIKPSFSIKNQLLVAALLLLSCLAKEIGAVWLVLIPLGRRLTAPEKPMALIAKCALPVAGVALWFVLRISAIGTASEATMMHDPLNNPFVHPAKGEWVIPEGAAGDSSLLYQRVWKGTPATPATTAEKLATVAYCGSRYIQLMLMPVPLTHDYYPQHIALKNWSDMFVWVGVLALAGFLFDGIRRYRNKSLTGLGILWFLLALLPVSNLFFPVGVFMAERFLMLPSAGFCIAVAAMCMRIPVAAAWHNRVLSAVFVLLGAQTVTRNGDWSSNETLFRSDILHSPESAKLEFGLANVLMAKALTVKDSVQRVESIRETIPYFEKAVVIHPFYFDAWQGVGASRFFTGNYEKALHAYAVANAIKPGDQLTLQNLAAVKTMYTAHPSSK